MTAIPRPASALGRSVCGTAIGALAILAAVVSVGSADAMDALARETVRPGGVWGPLQIRADVVVEGLRPANLVGPLALAGVAACLVRRSIRPVVLVAVAGGLLVLLTAGTKLLVARPDPHGVVAEHGGSFPSGHTAALVVCAGVVVLLLRPRPRWGWLVPAFAGVLMGACLMVQAAHWLTDVLGGGLVGIAVLAAVSVGGADRWAAGGR